MKNNKTNRKQRKEICVVVKEEEVEALGRKNEFEKECHFFPFVHIPPPKKNSQV